MPLPIGPDRDRHVAAELELVGEHGVQRLVAHDGQHHFADLAADLQAEAAGHQVVEGRLAPAVAAARRQHAIAAFGAEDEAALVELGEDEDRLGPLHVARQLAELDRGDQLVEADARLVQHLLLLGQRQGGARADNRSGHGQSGKHERTAGQHGQPPEDPRRWVPGDFLTTWSVPGGTRDTQRNKAAQWPDAAAWRHKNVNGPGLQRARTSTG